MNFNQSRPESTTPLHSQIHDFMTMPSSSNHDLSEPKKNKSFKDETEQNMKSFWTERLSEIHEAPTDERTSHALPLSRIKKAMKSDQNVKGQMISSATPVVFAKACEMLVMELSTRAWMHAQQSKRRTLQRCDVAHAITHQHLLPFLNDLQPHRQDSDPPIPNDAGVYVPLPVRGAPLDYPMYLQTLPNESEVAAAGGGPAAGDDHRLGFPMNSRDNSSPGFHSGMQEINPDSLPPSPSADGKDPYFSLKDFFQ